MGLGDGLITLVLSHNLHIHGYETVTFHPFLSALQEWFPHLPIRPFPALEELATFDRFFLFYERSSQMKEILDYCETHFPKATAVLNPIATSHKDYPYWEVGRFEGTKPFVENLYRYSKEILGLEKAERGNGIMPPAGFQARRFMQRVAIHPTSSRPGKNWPKEKFIAMAKRLEEEGFKPEFILSSQERKGWEDVQAPLFSTLAEMAFFVGESGFMVGNDSGVGHLASLFGLPTLTICRSRENGAFWRPSWSQNELVTPYPWIPNVKGFRFRDTHWKECVTVGRVMRAFRQLKDSSERSPQESG